MNAPTIFILNYIHQLGNTTYNFGSGNIPLGSEISYPSNIPLDSRLIPGLGIIPAVQSKFTVNPTYQGNPLFLPNIPVPVNPAFLGNQTYPFNPTIPVNPADTANSLFPANIPVPVNPILTGNQYQTVVTDSTIKPPVIISPSIPTSTEPSSDIEVTSLEPPRPTPPKLTPRTTSTTTTEPTAPKGECFPQTETCGQHEDEDDPNSSERIDRNPWNVLLEYDTGDETDFYCGGSLITNRYVITAASCIVDLPSGWSLIGVRLGEWDINTAAACYDEGCAEPSYDIGIENIIPHEEYNPKSRNFINNIALVRLANNIRFTKFVSPICLPIASHLRNVDYTDLLLENAGWARSLVDTSAMTKFTDLVKGITLKKCNTFYLQRNIEIQDSQICVYRDISCSVDLGGALTIKTEENTLPSFYYLAGIASINVAPCDDTYPGVYTRVGSYIDWIENIVC